MEDDDAVPGFIPNSAMDGATRARAPADERPYDDDEDTSFCFASKYMPDDENDPTNLGANEMKEAFAQMNAIISQHFAKSTSMVDLVDAVYEFYNSSIRIHTDHGEWTK